MSRKFNVFPMQKLPEWQLGYIAGIIDGEGCVTLIRNKTGYISQSIRVDMTSASCIRLLYSSTLIGAMYVADRKGQRKVYSWQISDRLQVYSLLRAIHPYLIIKQEQAELVMQFIERRIRKATMGSYDLELCNKVKDLKKVG